MGVEVDVEFCGTCGYFKKFEELAQHIKAKHPDIELNGHEGRRATFEVKVNGTLVHSKLTTLAYPDYDDLSAIIDEVAQGKEPRSCKQQPITSCIIA
ncbi:migration and invasion enhancer 1 [Tribolium castaneum]|uniref:Migration and invasion enhancer 1 n=1 Tax=Tribolium castaneum TaxID=7070 RepID=D6WBT4_TRICA|nr:PREDICTED: migration and invasion enhancer 1 isoform X1 [Tribolium castaneum]EEZ98745.1 Migration and invasion enhancer 1-like Protein [Tribolium castaneum]|eukprot:XP_968954.1 PREDICTED: migration and invasion enhancer 1 isoform X1 [Tribolium castaneum]